MVWYYLIALIVFVLDRISKWIVVNYMELYESIPVIGQFFLITSHRNTGAAFGILQGQRWFFIIVTSIVLVGLVWYLHKIYKDNNKRLLGIALSLVLGGAVGNFVDRIYNGQVVDFFDFRFQFSFFGYPVDYHFAIFNIADSAIVVGVILIFLDTLLEWREEKRGLKNNDTE